MADNSFIVKLTPTETSIRLTEGINKSKHLTQLIDFYCEEAPFKFCAGRSYTYDVIIKQTSKEMEEHMDVFELIFPTQNVNLNENSPTIYGSTGLIFTHLSPNPLITRNYVLMFLKYV